MRYSCPMTRSATLPADDPDGVPGDLVVALVNTWGTTPRAVAGEEAEPFPKFDRLCTTFGLKPARFGFRPRDADLVEIADALYPVFAESSDAARVRMLNGLLASVDPTPQLVRAGDGWALTWSMPAGSRRLLGACALTLLAFTVRQADIQRLGICSGDQCADVYMDASPPGRRRFCDISCQNRARVAAFRQRNRLKRGTPDSRR